MPDNTTCDDPRNLGKYIVKFTCGNVETTQRVLKESRLSFPSGHSSFAFYTMVYLAVSQLNFTIKIILNLLYMHTYKCVFNFFLQLYLQSRMTWHGSKLLRHFLQFGFIMIAWYTALSRVSDYKHHWSDVLAGSAIGSLTAVVVVSLFNFYSISCI